MRGHVEPCDVSPCDVACGMRLPVNTLKKPNAPQLRLILGPLRRTVLYFG